MEVERQKYIIDVEKKELFIATVIFEFFSALLLFPDLALFSSFWYAIINVNFSLLCRHTHSAHIISHFPCACVLKINFCSHCIELERKEHFQVMNKCSHAVKYLSY